MKNTFLLLIIVCLGGWSSVSAERTLSLMEAFTLAEAHSFTLRQAQASQQAYEVQVNAIAAERYPSLSVTAFASYKNELPQLNISSPSFTLDRELGSNEVYQMDLQVSVPLYTGGRISGSIRQATATAQAQKASAVSEQEKVYLQTRQAYLTVIRAEYVRQVTQASLKRTEIINQQVAVMFDAGTVDSTALLDAALAVNRQALSHTAADIEYRTALVELAIMLGLDPAEKIVLTDKIAPPVQNVRSYSSTFEHKPELKMITALMERDRAAVSIAKAGYLPTVSLFGGYAYGKPNNNLFEDKFNDYLTAGVSLNWLFNFGGKTKASQTSAMYRLKVAQEQYNEIEEQLTREERILQERLQLAYSAYQTADENAILQNRSYKLALLQHTEGSITTNRLLEIEALLAEADANRSVKQIDYYLIQSQLFYVSGNQQLKEAF